ncbi:Ribosomal RNA small subunit methyltransferase G [Caloramator mitchellensis]|uniref:Ribosomal RNA small subunit methyltransferase G n=1 Tax=Caloramator mitchellensis TaxID=908809 RepID=A0A0R3JXM5_CALMK|nr:16S rRNA (guanine(527)-N(7))-methyltransferase RsmG [Caloramator mitchellensis]KRQ85950.1 Ribosomal RNA small subunit methyltransferase G [Caloramator mitchellensis]
MMREILIIGARNYGIELDEEKVEKFLKYMELLKSWNEKINLTAITDDIEIIKKHFLDSISIVKSNLIKDDASIIDVGTGAGFPGIPIKIIKPNTKVVLLDSLQKRVNFLNEVIKELNLKGIEAVHSRAEDAAKSEKYREKFDISTARAVAHMSILSEYCIPFVKVNGHFIALKGPTVDEEINESRNAIGTLGGKLKSIIETTIPEYDVNHKLIIVEKIKETDKKYPRKPSQIEKKPIK